MTRIKGARAGVAAIALLAGGYAMPAAAQPSDEAVLGILRECAKIEDPTARLNCYDSNIRPGGSSGQRPAQKSGPDAVPPVPAVQEFGAESVKREDRFQSAEERGEGADEIRPRILDVRERQPGVYLVTVEGGAQWLFSDSVSRSFRPPRKGAIVEIRRASLGSFLMVVDGQGAVRVRRVK